MTNILSRGAGNIAHRIASGFDLTPMTRMCKNSIIPTDCHKLLTFYYNYTIDRDNQAWASAGNDGDRWQPRGYADIDDVVHEFVNHVEEMSTTESSVLDMCCNCGRYLAVLWQRGYRSLHGVDINHQAIDYSKEQFPAMQNDVEFEVMTLQDYLLKTSDQAFDVTYTCGTSIEFVPPNFPLTAEICRITRKSCILMLQEAAPPFPRLWEYEFNKHGFYLLAKILCPQDELTTRTHIYKFCRLPPRHNTEN